MAKESNPPASRHRSKSAQTATPEGFRRLWRVGGWIDEHEHAGRLCKSLGYERDEDGRDVVRVEFVELRDLFEESQALFSPHMLSPAEERE